jgi:hypothetical protein
MPGVTMPNMNVHRGFIHVELEQTVYVTVPVENDADVLGVLESKHIEPDNIDVEYQEDFVEIAFPLKVGGMSYESALEVFEQRYKEIMTAFQEAGFIEVPAERAH